MGLKGELGDGFPQLKPAFNITFDWDAAHILGPTTYPKNRLSYVKVHGTVKSVPDSSLPPFAADFVDGGVWLQEEVLPSGEPWVKTEGFALLKVIEPQLPQHTLADLTLAETETGLIRLKWNAIATLPETMEPAITKDVSELIRVMPREDNPGAAIVYSFETGDQRYKYLEHAVYVGKSRMVAVPPENTHDGRTMFFEVKVSYLAA